MKTMSTELFRKVCYILHRGFVESRLLASQAKHQQLFDLADAFEQIPSFMTDWNDDCLERLRSNLQTYQEKYPPSSFDYLGVLDMGDREFTDVLAHF
jgi:hypothetical protein